jgi:hypothetical protein
MGKITNEKDYIQVEIDPEQLVFRLVPFKGLNMTFGDVIGIVAWHLLRQFAPKFVKGRKFTLRSCDVSEGKFIVTFHEKEPEHIPVPPELSASKVS